MPVDPAENTGYRGMTPVSNRWEPQEAVPSDASWPHMCQPRLHGDKARPAICPGAQPMNPRRCASTGKLALFSSRSNNRMVCIYLCLNQTDSLACTVMHEVVHFPAASPSEACCERVPTSRHMLYRAVYQSTTSEVHELVRKVVTDRSSALWWILGQKSLSGLLVSHTLPPLSMTPMAVSPSYLHHCHIRNVVGRGRSAGQRINRHTPGHHLLR